MTCPSNAWTCSDGRELERESERGWERSEIDWWWFESEWELEARLKVNEVDLDGKCEKERTSVRKGRKWEKGCMRWKAMSENGTLLRKMGKVKSAKEKVLSRVPMTEYCVRLRVCFFSCCACVAYMCVWVWVSVWRCMREKERRWLHVIQKRSNFTSL